MKHFEWNQNAPDGLGLYFQAWEPEGPMKAVVCLVHGLGEHSGRYGHVGEFLARAGYALVASDLRGHGRSGGPRGHAPSFESILQDIDLLLEEARRRWPGLPLFLYGHSLGGLLVINYALRRKPALAGLVATGAGLRSPVLEQKGKLLFANTLASLLPTLSIPTGLDNRVLSRDLEVVNRYLSDPLVHDRVTLAFAKYGVQAVQYAFDHAGEMEAPLLLMHGTADQNTYPRGSEEYYALVRGERTLKLWDGLYHEIHNEPEKEQVLAYLCAWLNEKVERTQQQAGLA